MRRPMFFAVLVELVYAAIVVVAGHCEAIVWDFTVNTLVPAVLIVMLAGLILHHPFYLAKQKELKEAEELRKKLQREHWEGRERDEDYRARVEFALRSMKENGGPMPLVGYGIQR